MAVTPNSIIVPQTPKWDAVIFSTSDTQGVFKTLATGGPNGSKVISLWVNNNDLIAHSVRLDLVRGGSPFGGVVVNVPAASGFNAVAPTVNLMAPSNWPGLPIDADGNPFFFLQSTADQLFTLFATAMSTGVSALVAVHSFRGDF